MPVQLVNITNISNQVIPILYGRTTLEGSASDVDFDAEGQMFVGPSKSIEVEHSRIDDGQLEQLRRKGLISFTLR